MAKLYNTDSKQPHIILLRKPQGLLIGRSSSCDIKITGADVSSKHSKISLANNKARDYFFITDLSSNGTFVNNEKLGHGTSALLNSGDKVAFAKTGGVYIFRYCVDEVDNVKTSLFDDYILGKQLGSGHYAVVKEAKNRLTGEIVAVKIFHPSKTQQDFEEDETRLQQEIDLLLSIDHPNIVKFISRYVEPINKYSLSTYLVLEKVNNGELFQRIVNKLKLREDETKALFQQLLSGLNYLHQKKIIHRDIKPENILLDITPRSSPQQQPTGPWDDNEYDIRVKIADFGLAKFIGELQFTNTLCGTPAYVAPEILSDQRNYTTKADLWLSGVVLYVCLCGFPPFSEELGPPNMREQILTAKYAFYSPYWDDIGDTALDLISSLLVLDPTERLDVSSATNHPWFKESDDFTSSSNMLTDLIPKDDTNNDVIREPIGSNSPPVSLKQRFSKVQSMSD